MSLEIFMGKKDEEVLVVKFPLEGKMLVEDMAYLLGVSIGTAKKVVKQKNIMYHRIGYKWVVDLTDFWSKV